MKNVLLSVVLSLITTNALAINLKDFHDTNYDALGGRYCGLHLEVSGNSLIVTYIIPPRSRETAVCGGGESDDFSSCNGTSQELTCDENGTCVNAEGDHGGPLKMKLLDDGNIYNPTNGIKSIRSTDDGYSWCP